ncbi:conjugative relaxase-like TrwC/TraI family protein [Microbacterium trichothecenolyticum]|uniref:relaxase domain-containing protein n=1 Tax=Microbacterium trichothecenolyticum TaxID=69370 RepID=UPI0028545479|nr:relaxase domain-containing protein [Microbacterium trichothecenolyticum]MDR7112237.1 conjugative relaxase-like TrwC/TraI family protein [Microbacterium trichothecenolyticum]
MRGGLRSWKRGADSRGIRNAISYAFEGTCDAHHREPIGADMAARYAERDESTVTRFTVVNDAIARDELDTSALRHWIQGENPATGEARGLVSRSENSDLMLDGTINFPKSYSIAALLAPDLALEFEALQDRMRDRTITLWQSQLNARRGRGGSIREDIARLEVVELQHRRSRALDPHIHRHLWLNMKVQGVDGKWSSLDSRVAMKFQTVVNAEGELAARTDPRWIAVLAAHGYTLDDDGEIAQLAHVVRPLSRRSNKIEANRMRLIGAWRASIRAASRAPKSCTTSMPWRGRRVARTNRRTLTKQSGKPECVPSLARSTRSCSGLAVAPGMSRGCSPISTATCLRRWRSPMPTPGRCRAAGGSRRGTFARE